MTTQPMTPEALWAYLKAKGFDEDSVQSAICAYLSTKSTVRHPKAWGWQAALHARQNQAIKDRASRHPPISLDRVNPDPLRVVVAHQALARALQSLPKRPRGRPRQGGLQAWREDYRAWCQEG